MKRLLQSHAAVALDTSLFIYHFEDHPRYRDLTSHILRAVSKGECGAVVSELTLLELLVRPLQLERQDVELVVRIFWQGISSTMEGSLER